VSSRSDPEQQGAIVTDLKKLCISAFALSMFAACSQGEDPGQAQIQVAGPDGAAHSVTVLDSQRAAGSSYAEVRIGDREFTLSQWVDAATSARHSAVASSDGSLRYEYVANGLDARLVIADRAGTRVVPAGGALGNLDRDAATLLMSLRPGADGVAYSYSTYCVGYDTSDPNDWHLVVGSCTCAHWYSVICTMD
jgi:hypothetical protein